MENRGANSKLIKAIKRKYTNTRNYERTRNNQSEFVIQEGQKRGCFKSHIIHYYYGQNIKNL